ncbi:carboxypeptidase-like regulatory domain-containing protein [Lewinella cohaerens]|uniref:carboxypeptidase-like regulatory domain-containing protein n=1 Tax=Lewinella cohaerens TaxID=70995 RepID=UPI00037FB00B|nr:carboxypeptidase-like regulatory domain-containing protein [Lewinella cohaerens]
MKNWIFLLLALPLVIFSCRKDNDITTTTGSGYEAPTIIVTANLAGQVVDLNGIGIENAMVRLGSEVAVTNDAGLYQFRDIQMNAKGTYVTVTKEGYFLGSDRFYPANGSRNVNRIQLLPKTLAATITGNQGGTIEVEGASIELPANSVVNPQGQVVTGDVKVYAQWLDPTDDNLGDFMPGGLFGVNEAGQEVTMTSMGMLAVELYDQSGNELQMAPGQEAMLSYPVPAELRSIAPVEIPLWYFDETDGVWIEDGKAIMEGDFYYGEVSHFTFWNVDFPYGTETVDISGCVKFEDGSIAPFESFTVGVEGQGTIIWGTTDDAGHYYGPVPTGETLNFYFSNPCGGSQVFTAGPFSEDTEVTGCFILESADDATISGQVVDCSGDPVDGAIVMLNHSIWWYSQVAVADENGNFSYTYSGCSSTELNIVVYDFDNLESSEPASYTLTEDLDLGTIAACGVELESYLSSDANGTLLDFYDLTLAIDTIELSPDSIIFETYSVISGRGFDEDNNQHTIMLYLNELGLGSYTGIDVGYNYSIYSNSPNGNSSLLYCYPPCGSITVNITNNEGPGGFLEGNYSGTANGWWGSQQQQVLDAPVSGTFRVRIPQ